MESLLQNLDNMITFLEPLLPLANSHTVNFIVEKPWDTLVPNEIKLEVDLIGVNEVLRKLWKDLDVGSTECYITDFVRKCRNNTVESSDCFLSFVELESRLDKLITNNYNPIKLKEFMSSKKIHEVEIMSKVVSRIAAATNASHLVDIGSGKGYLTSTLVLQHRFKVLGIDCSKINIHSASRRSLKFEKYWGALKKKSDKNTTEPSEQKTPMNNENNGNVNITKEKLSTYEEYYNKYKWKSVILNNMYKQCSENVNSNTNLLNLLKDSYPNEYCDNICVIGLHTCGDLAASCLKLFANEENRIKSVINIGCCYHLMEEEFATNPRWCKDSVNQLKTSYGFPLSSHLRNKGFSLGRDARMCGTQFPVKTFKERKLSESTKPLFYRALFQEFLVKKYGVDDFPKGNVGRLAHKCESFVEYVDKALERLQLDILVDRNELQKLQLQYVEDWDRLKIFFLLKTALSPVIESVILMDRVLYLYEQGISDAFVTQLFDPLLSPRCYAVIGIKNNPTISLFV